MNIGHEIQTIVLSMVLRAFVNFVVTRFKKLISNWPESWPEKRGIAVAITWLVPMFLLVGLAFVIRLYVFGSPDPATPPTLTVAIFFVLVLVGVALYDLASFGIKKFKNRGTGRPSD